jgi:hypothetical protein
MLQLKQKIDRERRLRKKYKETDKLADAGGPAAAA